VAPSALRSPITPFKPRALTRWGIGKTIADYARCAQLAQRAGYDGVEIMGSEGYLINQFVAPHTNHRDDDWGGTFEHRIRLPVEIVRRNAGRGGQRLHHHLPAVDARPGRGRQHWTRSWRWARRSRPPARRSSTPASAGTRRASDHRDDGAARRVHLGDRRMKSELRIPLITHNRINDPAVAEAVLARGDADMVSMARAVSRRRRVRQQGGAGPRRRDQHLHRLQPGVPRSHLRAADRLVPRQCRAPAARRRSWSSRRR